MHAKNTAQAYLTKDNQKRFTPTPAVNHFVMEEWAVRPGMRGPTPPPGQVGPDYEDGLEAGAAVRGAPVRTVPRNSNVGNWVPPPTAVYEMDGYGPGEAVGEGHYYPEQRKPQRVNAWAGPASPTAVQAPPKQRRSEDNRNAGGRHTAARSAPMGLEVTGKALLQGGGCTS